ncbi:MAG: GrdX family protein, partial [Clostridium sp.]|nr:GrdX family protein [Clostridium sp.]
GGSMESVSTYLIITNNPLVVECVPKAYAVEYHDISYREILVKVRDMVYAGHRLYTHPLAGSVKPNETPYKSVVVSKLPKKMEQDEAMIISSSIETFDKFTPIRRELPERVLRDFRLIDYTLLCGAVGLDAVAGLSNRK